MIPRWLLWTLLAVVSWGVWAIFSRIIGEALSANHSQALSTLGLLPVMLMLLASGKLKVTRKGSLGATCALGAGVLTCLGNAAYYDVLNRGAKTATVVPLPALDPLITIVLAVLLLKERLNGVQLVGMILSLAAIYLFNGATTDGIRPAALGWVLAPILLWGAAGLLQKLSTNHVTGELAALWFLGAFVPVAMFILVREPLPAAIGTKVWLQVSGLGFFFALGNAALLAAFASHGKASIIAPLASLYPLVSVPLAIVLLGEQVGVRETAGIVLALVAVVAMSWETPSATAVVNASNQH